jgi:hypothetical protein
LVYCILASPEGDPKHAKECVALQARLRPCWYPVADATGKYVPPSGLNQYVPPSGLNKNVTSLITCGHSTDGVSAL